MSVVGPSHEAAENPEDPAEPRRRAPAIRPFLLTTGRVSAGGDFPPMPVETQIVSTSAGLLALNSLTFERHDIVAAGRRPLSVAELAAGLRLHLNVVRVLVEDLRVAGHLAVHRPNAAIAQDLSVLRRVIDGLRAVPDSRGTLRDTS
ncbi:DUF742 domain-containing protein [Streptomyces sp. NPDC004542]|uniref:DUF742 domain-containing protein n=1 Tax=Streptomyces sp. NPDC004542 TaxID=3154281 RepID=UPI0033A04708